MTDTDTPTVAGLLTAYARNQGQQDWLKERQGEIRRQLDDYARRQWRETGALPNLKVKGVGTMWLVDGGPAARVIQPDAYNHWAAEQYPDRASLTIVVPVTRVAADDFQRILERLRLIAERFDTTVDPDLLAELTAGGHLDIEAGVLVDDSGEKVPGVRVEMTEPQLRVRPAPEAKAAVAESLTTSEVAL